MKKILPVLTLTLTAALLSGCRSDSDADQNVTDTVSDITTALSIVSSDKNTTTNSSFIHSTTSAHTSDEQSETDASASDNTILSTTDTSSVVQQDEPEQQGDTPYPTYFNYRFSPDGITVRLSGGNYQVLSIDLSASIDQNLDFLYRLEDFNFDGNPDLMVPVQFGTSNVLYGLFIWEQDTAHFREQPINIFNPNVHPAEKTICARITESASVQSLEIYTWNQEQLELQTKYSADYKAVTLTTLQMDDPEALIPQIQTFSSATELEAAFLSLH